ncbi:unnamed protein product [Diabrotica balteata]|uniref:Uncharacterized protein n=1 Tax=Diabrotica balteata TaxID=107213 RepID=A0A9N9X8U7_DIABA|nr:unnamed protein product [Diabrotica balteata]
MDVDGRDQYEYPKMVSKFVSVKSGNDMNTERCVESIIRNRFQFEDRNTKKELKEMEILQKMKELELRRR